MHPSPSKKLRTPSPAILPETSSIASPYQKTASHKLPDEILDYIFKIIINSEEDRILERPLMTLFRASSVCKRWRNFLHEPSIWGRVIDLDCMVQRKGNFRILVMERTRGAADLDVKGVIDDEDPLVLFLRTWTEPQHFNGHHWHRMRRLDLTIRDADLFDEVHALLATTPPHNLQSLRVIFQKYRYEESPLPIAFNTDIPSLLNLDTNVFYLPHRAANLSTLKSLSISFRNQSQVPYTLVDFADVLSQMTELESLDFCDAFLPDRQSPSLPTIYLPHLREMRITNDYECFALLEAIIPHTACSIDIHIIESLDDNIMVLRNVLSRYAGNFAKARIVETIQVELAEYNIIVRLAATSSEQHRERTPGFSFNAKLASHRHTLAVLLGVFDTCDLRRVTTLDLNLLTNTIRTRPTIPSPEIRHLISSLSGVQTLVTNMRTIKHLDGITTPQRIFPSLQTLKLTSLITSYGDERLINNDGNPARLRVDAKLLTDFLSIRTGTVHGLDLTQCALEDSVRFLDSPPFKHLKVMWKNNDGQRKVYTCGGGTPTCLDFGHFYE